MKSITLFAILTLASFYLSLQPTNAADHKAGDKEAIFNNAKAFVDAFEKGYAKPRQPFGGGWRLCGSHPVAVCRAAPSSLTRFVWVNGQMQANGPHDLRGCERAAEAIQADTAFRLGPALRRYGRGAGRCGRRYEEPAAREGAADGYQRLLRTACAAAKGRPPGPG